MDLSDGSVRGRNTTLSPTERRLLAVLASASPAIVPRTELLQQVWGLPADTTSRTLYATMDRLRRKVERDPSAPEVVLTVAGRGYQYVPPSGLGAPAGGRGRHLDDFVGRSEEIDALARWLLGPDTGLLGLHGPPGVGRSRLLAELARRHEASLADVTWVDLRGVTRLETLCVRLAAAVAHPVAPTERGRQRLGRLLAGRGLALLVLDDADALDEEARDWLATWPRPRPRIALVTRVPTVSGARPVPPLRAAEARELFARRAGARFPRWRPTEEEESAIDDLVRALHGVPLAIELLAGPAVVLGAARLSRTVAQAPFPAVDRVTRWVWDRRSPEERAILCALAVLAVATPIAQVEQLLQEHGLPLWPLAALVQDGALQVLELDEGRSVTMSASLRDQALSEGDAEAARAAHARCFGAGGTDERVEALTRHGDAAALAAARRSLPDLRRAGAWPGLHGARAGRLASYLLLHLGAHDEARRVLEGLAAREGLPAGLRVWVERMRGEALRRVGQVDAARAALDEALQVARREAPDRVGRVLHARGVLESVHAGDAVAEALFAEASKVHEAVGDDFRRGLSEAELATVHLRRGHAERAVPLFQQALSRLRALDCPVSEAIYLGNLAVAHLRLEQFDASREALELALTLSRRLDARRLIASHLSNLGLLAAQVDALDEATERYEEALSVLEGMGEPMEVTVTRVNLADVARRRGQLAMARRWLDRAEGALGALALRLPLANARLVRAALARAEGAVDADAVAEAGAIIDELGATDLWPRWRCEEAHLAWSRGDRAAAIAGYDEARQRAEEGAQGPRTEAGRAVTELGELLGL